MKMSLLHQKLTDCLLKAAQHNSQTMVRPEVILWPDPERQWAEVVPVLQRRLAALLVLGAYDPAKRQGPAIWLKCMVAKVLPEARWGDDETPILYLPGISKNDLKNLPTAGLTLQPLAEYQYTGAVFGQTNGREWTVTALLENQQVGLGLSVAKDKATREALIKALPLLLEDPDIRYPETAIDAGFLQALLFPNMVEDVLKWLREGDRFLQQLPKEKADTFTAICKSHYGFEPDVRNIKAIAAQLGSQRNAWRQVWQHFANAPAKYPELHELLRMAKPDDLGSGVFACPEESWPQVNEAYEEKLSKELTAVAAMEPAAALTRLQALEQQHGKRRAWVWAELEQSPLAMALPYLTEMVEAVKQPVASQNIKAISDFYVRAGYKADQCMRHALATVKRGDAYDIVTAVIRAIYLPWLEKMTLKFQELAVAEPSVFEDQAYSRTNDEYVLFVDALRYELAMEFHDRLGQKGYKVGITPGWSALPSLTPTAKPAVSPLQQRVSTSSAFNEFRPQLEQGADLTTAKFRSELAAQDVVFVSSHADIQIGKRHWQEIGDIDSKGHTEQAGMVRRVGELFEQMEDALHAAFKKGIKTIRVVTDHGWLLMPGGLPKATLSQDLVETRWGRCASMKQGANTDLLHLPWRWNPGTYIAYAPGISFFKKNEEYAHGGLSVQECLVPVMTVENTAVGRPSAVLKEIKWTNLNCKIETADAPDGYLVDIRTRYDDPGSSVVLSAGKVIRDNKISLMVDDAAESQSVTVVLLNAEGMILDKKPTLVGG